MKNESKSFENNFEQSNVCPFCGTVLSEVNANKKAGCFFCYELFKDEIERIIKEKIGDNVYSGKVPGTDNALVPLNKNTAITISGVSMKEVKKRLLNIAIKEERYEDAAILRDEIKEIEKNREADDYE